MESVLLCVIGMLSSQDNCNGLKHGTHRVLRRDALSRCCFMRLSCFQARITGCKKHAYMYVYMHACIHTWNTFLQARTTATRRRISRHQLQSRTKIIWTADEALPTHMNVGMSTYSFIYMVETADLPLNITRWCGRMNRHG